MDDRKRKSACLRRTEDGSTVTVATCESTVGRLVSDCASRKGKSTNEVDDPIDSVGENMALTEIQDTLLTNAKDSQEVTHLKTSVHSVFLLPSSDREVKCAEVPSQPPNPHFLTDVTSHRLHRIYQLIGSQGAGK